MRRARWSAARWGMEAAGDGVVVVVVGRPSPVVGTVGTVGDGTVWTVTVGRWAGGHPHLRVGARAGGRERHAREEHHHGGANGHEPGLAAAAGAGEVGPQPGEHRVGVARGGAVDPSRRASSVSAGSNPKSSSVMVRPPFPSRFP